MPAGWLERVDWAFTSSRFLAFGHDFGIRTMDPALGRYVAQALGSLGAPGRPASWYSFVDRGPQLERRYALYFNGQPEVLSGSPRTTLSRLLWHVNRAAVASCADQVLVHAAAAEHDGRALLFPAPMEAGKTTLVAGLVRAGLRYLTDEAAAIDPGSLRVSGLAKPLTIDSGSWNVLAELEPAVDPQVKHYMDTRWHVDVRTIRTDALAVSAAPAYVIVPRYVPGAKTALAALGRPQALVALCENSFNLNELGQGGLSALASVVRASSCYRLVVGDLRAATSLILDLLAGSEPVATTSNYETGIGDAPRSVGEGTARMIDGTWLPMPRPSAASVEIDGESVLLDCAMGVVHHLDAVGTLIWACFDGSTSIDRLAADLSGAFAATEHGVRRDLLAFVRSLDRRGLLASPGGPSAGCVDEGIAGGPQRPGASG